MSFRKWSATVPGALGVLLAGLAVCSASALAAAPEVPELTVVAPVPATSATFLGVLSPNAKEPNEGGTYTFLYRASKTECEGGSETASGLALGAPHEELPGEPVSGLTPNTEYTVCLSVTNLASETTLSPPVTFTTALPPETPVTGSPATFITAASADLEGRLNPKAPGNPGSYEFLYRLSTSECEGESATAQEPAAGGKGEPAKAQLTALQPSAQYTFCLLARNEAGETAVGSPVTLTTLPAPPAVDSQAASAVNATSATLEAQVNPNNQETSYTFEYSTQESGGALEGTITKLEGSAPLSAGFGDQPASVPTGAVLTAGTAYFYRVVATNAAHETTDGTVQSFTTIPAPSTDPVSAIGATTATFNGHLTLNAVDTAYSFEYKPGTECSGGSATPAADASTGSTSAALTAPVTGLLQDTTYTVCLLATNQFGSQQGPPVTFRTLPEAYATKLASTSVTLHTVLNPEGSPTSYHFEYGPTAAYGSETAQTSAEEGTTPTSFETHVQGLSAETLYHYRVVATNAAHETFTSVDHTFTTHATGGEFALPDGRQWEMVSPANLHGASLEVALWGFNAFQASEDGTRLTYAASAPTEPSPQGNPAVEHTQVLSTRGAGGWQSTDLNPATEEVNEFHHGTQNGFQQFSPDLSLALLVPETATPLPPLTAGAEKTGYLRKNTECAATPTEAVPATCYLPLLTAADATPGAKWGGENGGAGPVFVAGTPDLRHVVFDSREQLTSNAVKHEAGALNVYEWNRGKEGKEGTLELVGVGVFSNLQSNGFGFGVYRHAISNDGNRLVWNPGSTGEHGELAVSDMARKETVPLDSEPTRTLFQTASSDGSRIFFKPTGLSEEPGNLDVFEAEADQPLSAGHMTELSPGLPVHGAVIGASESGCDVGGGEGCYVYFVSGEALYVVHYDESSGNWEAPRLIAKLDGGRDGSAWDEAFANGSPNPAFPEFLAYLSTQVSPNGRFVAFMSSRSLTGYDNTDVNEASGAHADQEVYVYDAQTGRLACASCNPTGARPAGLFDETSLFNLPLVDPNLFHHQTWGGEWLAGSVPGWEVSNAYQPRYVADSGRVFFDGADALVPADVNGVEDVYQYEPEGVGPAGGARCGPQAASAGVVFRPARMFEVEGRAGEEPAGCVGLISSGSSGKESVFVDSSVGGGDVFFLSTAHLVPEDVGSGYEMFDAHECSSGSPCITPASGVPACTTADSCRSAPSSQPSIFGASGSQTFSGSGNVPPAPPGRPLTAAQIRAQKLAKALKACRRDRSRRKRAACERSARRKFGARKAGRSSHTSRNRRGRS
jgi:hypothetical protein